MSIKSPPPELLDAVEQGVGDARYGDQNTDGSNSVRGIYEDMRLAAATARTMLVDAAAVLVRIDAGESERPDG